MARKTKGYSDEKLLKLISAHLDAAVGYLDSHLERERTEVLEYYKAQKPARIRKGQSSYVSQDVFDAVEAMHAQLLETFTASTHLVKFAPQGPEDQVRARAMTEVVSYVLHRQNPGLQVMSSIVKDGLMARVGVAKVWWEASERTEEAEFRASDPMAVFMAAEQGGYELDQDSFGVDEAGEVSAKGRRTVDTSQVRIEAIPPAEFIVSRRARSLDKAPFVAHRVAKTRAELKAMGLSDEDIRRFRGEDNYTAFDTEESVRFDGIDEGSGLLDTDADDERFWIYEAYLKADLDGSGVVQRWKVTKAGNRILDKEPVRNLPFVAFVPLPIPHSFWGDNFAERVMSIQRAKTALTRAILDHTAATINPRLQVVRGTLSNPSELTDPRLGGIVNVSRPDGLIPLVQAPLNPFVMNIVQMMDSNAEEISGISRLSQGLNKDALSGNNSNALVETLTSNSQTRQKVIAKNFATGFLIPLYYLVADIMADNAPSAMMIEIAGEWQEVPPETWQTKRDLVAELHLGYGETDREVEKWLMLSQLLGNDPAMQPFYGPQQRYAVYRKVMELRGVKETTAYLIPPEQAQPPEPDPLMIAELELKKAEAQQKLAEVQLKTLETQAKVQEMQARLQIDATKVQQKFAVDSGRLELDWAKHELDKAVDMAEVEVMRRAQATSEVTAIASPNS